MDELFSIGEMSKLFSTNIRTLRYYDEINLLKPEVTDSKTGYRYYSTKQFERLNTIKYLRTLEMPLDKISHFFECKDTETLEKLLLEHKDATEKRLLELKRINKKIENRLNLLTNSSNSIVGNIIETHYKKRQIALLRKEIPIESDLEYPIRELEIKNKLEPIIFLGKVGVSISQENLLKRKFDKFSGIFVFLENEDTFNGKKMYLEESDYITIRFSGTHRDSDLYYKKLLKYISNNNYKINGDSVEVTLIDSGFTNDSSKFITEIQIPFIKYWLSSY